MSSRTQSWSTIGPPRHAQWWLPGAVGTALVGVLLARVAASGSLSWLIDRVQGAPLPPDHSGEWLFAAWVYVVVLAVLSGVAACSVVLIAASWQVARTGGWVCAWLCVVCGVTVAAPLYFLFR